MNMIEIMAFMGLGPWEIIIVVGVIVLLFGATKIPTLMRNMGTGISEFKKGIKEGEKEASEEVKKEKEEEKKEEKKEEIKSGDSDPPK